MKHYLIVLLILACVACFVHGKKYSKQEADKLVNMAAKMAEAVTGEMKTERSSNRRNGRDRIGKQSKDRHHGSTKQKLGAKPVIARGQTLLATTAALIKLTNMTMKELTTDPQLLAAFQSQEYLCQNTRISCDEDEHSTFRSDDGTCNNLNHPHWGAAFTAQRRYQAPDYGDGYDSPRTTGRNGQSLPPAREISNRLFKDDETAQDDRFSLIMFAFGQFLDHDFAATPVSEGEDSTTLTCCDGDIPLDRTDCFPLPLGADDNIFGGKRCMEFVRSAPASAFTDQCQPGPREQLNQLTSYIDGGNVYGDSRETWKVLADENTGFMRTKTPSKWYHWANGALLPGDGDHLPCELSDPLNDYCQNAVIWRRLVLMKRPPTFCDHRVNDVPSLGGMHLLFVRQHNRIAYKLKFLNPSWGPQRIFNETRKIIGALMQHVIYSEFLPQVLGATAMEKYNLFTLSEGYANVYNEDLNPTITNVFAVAAYRFGHSLIPPHIGYTLLDFTTLQTETITMPLDQTLLDPHLLITDGGNRVSDLARFLVSNSAQKVDVKFEDAVRNNLFKDENCKAFDLMALNIQRARDHGVPGYYAWRRWCSLSETLDDIPEYNRDILLELYGQGNGEDIDVFAGGMAERSNGDGATGPLFTCILGRQFKDLKEGDRFYYEGPQPAGFTIDQLKAIRRVSFARLFCENMGLDYIQPNVFLVPTVPGNSLMRCKDLRSLDLSAWKERRGWWNGRS